MFTYSIFDLRIAPLHVEKECVAKRMPVTSNTQHPWAQRWKSACNITELEFAEKNKC